MYRIQLQRKTLALPGFIECYWFENEQIGLANSLFHRITIPLAPFDSGLEYEEQPLETGLLLEWYKLGLKNPAQLDGLNLSHDIYPDAEASVYAGNAHNLCRVNKLELKRTGEDIYAVIGELEVDFEREGVGENELFRFNTTARYLGKSVQRCS